jgi:plasmid maintenance system antidote protein VapI
MIDSELSQYKIAQLSEVDSGTLSRFVNGQRSISLETADKLCRVLSLELTKIEQQQK